MANSKSWQLISSLLSALEINDLLHRFFQHLKDLDYCDAMRFSHHSLDVEAHFGISGRCRAQYNLELEGTFLGQILISRRRRFNIEDQLYLEQAIGLLVHPLHNAVRFQRMRLSALRDPLTNLQNRMSMNDYLEQELALLTRYKEAFSLLILDVDNFKQINDLHGHTIGDEILKMLACRLKESCRGSDAIFRYGGDEFVVAMPRANLENASHTAERLRETVANNPFMQNGLSIKVGISLGLASYCKGENVTQLLARADAAMYKAKTQGRNRFTINIQPPENSNQPSG